jgi:tyrosyl-tRNA synthetase
LSPSGAKFGKTEGGTSVWLDPERTSPYAFYQYWLNVDDRDVGTYLRWFTELDRERDRGARGARRRAPEARRRSGRSPRRHRADARREAPSEPSRLRGVLGAGRSDPGGLATLHERPAGSVRDPTAARRRAACWRGGLFGSKGEARRLIAGGG